ncbi:MAG: 6-carboxyhexanoate--CoA ligase [Bacilli bacterium]|nr:6-carboxyhexanoate--CoA ligase [Bacilli bacterium]
MEDLYSVRMRSAKGGSHEHGGEHISGAERLVHRDVLSAVVMEMMERALQHEKGQPDFINLTVELAEAAIIRGLQALPADTLPAKNVEEGHQLAVDALTEIGVSTYAARQAVQLLKTGPSPKGGVMRGAIIMDAETGKRLEPDQHRGVRATKIDWAPETLMHWGDAVSQLGFNRPRVWEAIALAAKVVNHPCTVAELCWSDDPGYVTGYVASLKRGYLRIPHLKKPGDPLGGRVFFVRTTDFNLAAYIEYLEQTPAIINRLPDGMTKKEADLL